MIRIIYLWILISINFTCFAAGQINAINRDLETRLNAMRTMRASFSQTVVSGHRGASRSSGTMALVRPGHFRWETHTPMKQLLVADGKRFWIYDVDLEQVTVKSQMTGLNGTAGLFLSGYHRDIGRDFRIKAAQKGHETYFYLYPLSAKGSFREVVLIFKQAMLIGLNLVDSLGQRTTITFSHVQMNVSIPTGTFQFKIPHGVDVVRQ